MLLSWIIKEKSVLLSCEFSKAMTWTLFLSPAVLRWRGWGSSSVSSFFICRLGITGSFGLRLSKWPLGLEFAGCGWGLEAGEDGGCGGLGLLARDLQLLIWEKELKGSTCVPFILGQIPVPLFFFFYYPVLLFVHLLSTTVPCFWTS